MQNPYIGPKPFQMEEAHLFFGRDMETLDIISLIIAHQTVVLYSQSGAGKSSLLNTKIIGGLRQEGFNVLPIIRLNQGYLFHKYSFTSVYSCNTLLQLNSGKEERGVIHTSIAEYFDEKYREKNTNKEEAENDSTVGQVDNKFDNKIIPEVLIFDQFEEVFTLYNEYWEQRKVFFEDLARCIEQNKHLRIVFLIREDFIAQLEPFKYFFSDDLEINYRLEKLNHDKALESVIKPLLMTNNARHFDEGVAEKLVSELQKEKVIGEDQNIIEVLGEFVEPVQLQVVCYTLWENLPEREKIITYDHVASFGDPNKSLIKFYDDTIISVLNKVKTIDEKRVRNFFETKLITPLGTRGIVFRDTYSTEGIPNKVIDILAEAHIINGEFRSGTFWYELTHDRFIEPIQNSNKEFFLRISSLNVFDKIEFKRKEAAQAFRAKRYSAAIDLFDEILKLCRETKDYSGQYDSLINLGWLYGNEKKYNKSLDYINKAQELLQLLKLEFSEEDYSYKAEILLQAGHYQESVEILKGLLNKFDKDEYLLKIGNSYWYAGNTKKALAYYNIYLDKVNNPAPTWYNGRGQILAEHKRYKNAESDLTYSIDHAETPDVRAYSLSGRGFARGMQKRFDEAFEDFNESLTICPDNAWTYFNRAQVKEEMNDDTSALKDYEISLEKDNQPLTPFKKKFALMRIKILTEKIG